MGGCFDAWVWGRIRWQRCTPPPIGWVWWPSGGVRPPPTALVPFQANQRLLELCYFLSESKEKEETNATYKGLHSALEHYILTTYNEWKDSVPDSLAPLLEINLISKIQV